jgi:hypothetical protein
MPSQNFTCRAKSSTRAERLVRWSSGSAEPDTHQRWGSPSTTGSQRAAEASSTRAWYSQAILWHVLPSSRGRSDIIELSQAIIPWSELVKFTIFSIVFSAVLKAKPAWRLTLLNRVNQRQGSSSECCLSVGFDPVLHRRQAGLHRLCRPARRPLSDFVGPCPAKPFHLSTAPERRFNSRLTNFAIDY